MTTAHPGPDGGEPRTAWFTRARFGLFIHWGIYAAAARHEWVKSQERLDDARYDAYFDHFDPDLYDPRAWAEEAWRAGMRYVVVTSKHHDGFCLWDSALTDYRATRTPHGKDLLRPMLDAFRDRGLRTGLYHSLLDWHHPQYPVDIHHPQRDDPAVRAQPRDVGRYADYLHGQVRELMSGYGRIDLAWFDFSFPGQGENAKGAAQWRSEQLLAMVRELQPHILVNDRLDLGGGDIITPEQVQPTAELVAGYPPGTVWEACHTLNGSWGYDRDNLDWKSADQLIRLLVDTVSLGGNLLLNVGPDARGQWEPRALERLRGIGEWMRLHSRSIREAGASRYSPPPDARYTQAGDRLYLHLFSWPTRHVHLPGLAGRVRYAQFLHDASEVRTVAVDPDDTASTALRGVPSGALTLELPVRRPDVAVPVVELFLGGER